MAAAIINPRAGGRSEAERQAFESLLRERVPGVDILHTQSAGHATELTRQALRDGHDLILAIGGDGTYNEVANGFFEDDAPINARAQLALVPDGTGADLARLIGLTDAASAIDVLTDGVPLTIDVCRCDFTGRDGEATSRYFLNITDFGMGGDIIERVNHGHSFFHGKLGYLAAILATLFTYTSKRMRVSVDGESFDDVFSSVIMANGQYFGNGIHVAPRARLTNGTMEVMLIRDMPLMASLRFLPKLYDGSYTELKDYVITRTATHLTAECDSPIFIDLDGEAPGQLPIVTRVIPSAITLRVPTDYFEAAPDASMASPSAQS